MGDVRQLLSSWRSDGWQGHTGQLPDPKRVLWAERKGHREVMRMLMMMVIVVVDDFAAFKNLNAYVIAGLIIELYNVFFFFFFFFFTILY